MMFNPISKSARNQVVFTITTLAFLTLCSSINSFDNSYPKDKTPEVCCSSEYDRKQFDSLDVKILGNEFQRLRKLNCRDCDDFGSDFAEIMRTLEKKLAGKSKREIKRIMGKPDEKDLTALIYYWRGRHDYLIFDFSGQKGAKPSWYYAYE